MTNVAVTFDGSGSTDPNGNGTIAAYWWQFGDGSSATVATPTVTHAYAASGNFTATLWVRDNVGAWSLAPDTATATISTGTTTSTVATPTTSSSTSTSTSRPSTTSGPTTSSTSSSTSTSTSLPNLPPLANAGPDQFTQTLTSITLNGGSSSDPDGTITLASWNFGDGTTGTGLTASHAYTSAGTYTATLSVIDNDGALDTDTATVTVSNRPPVANAGPDTGGAPQSMIGLNGTASADPDGSIANWAWAFGDGTTGSGSAPSHAYATSGTYTATLTVTDNHGAVASDSASVVVSSTSTTWARSLGSTGSDAAYSVAIDAAGNTIVGGAYRGTVNFGGTSFTSAGGADFFVAKYSPTGSPVWARSMGGVSDDFLEAVAVDGNGDVVVTGRFAGTANFGGTALVSNGITDMIVGKYAAANGAHLWSKRFGGVQDDTASAVAVDASNNVYFTGFFRGTANFGGANLTVPFTSDLDVFIAKLDATGAHIWSKNFTNNGNERGYGIAVDGSGNVVITGSFSNTVDFGGGGLTSANAMSDGYVARFTTAGVHSWSRRFGSPDGNESGQAVATDSSGNALVTGYATRAVDMGGGSLAMLGGTDGLIAKYAATSGNHVWSRRVGGGGNDYGYGITVDTAGASPTNNVYVTGAFDDTASFGGASLTAVGSPDVYLAKYGPTGTPLSARQFGGASTDISRGVDFAAGTPVVAGYFSGSGSFGGTTLTSAGLADGFVVRVAP